jgi:hypothetical protein
MVYVPKYWGREWWRWFYEPAPDTWSPFHSRWWRMKRRLFDRDSVWVVRRWWAPKWRRFRCRVGCHYWTRWEADPQRFKEAGVEPTLCCMYHYCRECPLEDFD